jgi:hypothetical protein
MLFALVHLTQERVLLRMVFPWPSLCLADDELLQIIYSEACLTRHTEHSIESAYLLKLMLQCLKPSSISDKIYFIHDKDRWKPIIYMLALIVQVYVLREVLRIEGVVL